MCAGGATTTVYPSTIAEDIGLHPRPTPSAGSSSPRTTSRSPSSREHKSELPAPGQGGHLRRHRRRRLGDRPGRPRRRSARSYLAEHPDAVDGDRRGDRAGPARHADLHLRHHRPAQGRAAAAPRRGPTRAPRSRRRTSSTRTTCSSCGCRWPTRSARCCSPPSSPCGFATAIDGRVDKIVENLGDREADVHGRRAAHLREGPRPDRHDAGGRGRRQGEDLQPGLRGRPARSTRSSARASPSRCR